MQADVPGPVGERKHVPITVPLVALRNTVPDGGGGSLGFAAVTVAVHVPVTPIMLTLQLTVVVVGRGVTVMNVLSPLGVLFASPGKNAVIVCGPPRAGV